MPQPCLQPDQIAQLARHAAPPEQSHAWETHLESCPHCQTAFKQFCSSQLLPPVAATGGTHDPPPAVTPAENPSPADLPGYQQLLEKIEHSSWWEAASAPAHTVAPPTYDVLSSVSDSPGDTEDSDVSTALDDMSSDDFLAVVQSSGCADERALRKFERHSISAPRQATATALARQLVEAGIISDLQIEFLVQGRANELFYGEYVLVSRLGAGGMGEIYRARHRVLGRMAALKVMRPDRLESNEALLRFRQEALLAARVDHPNVIRVYDAGLSEDRFYFAMELVEGSDLSTLVKQAGPIAWIHALGLIRQAAQGVQAAHEVGIVHRDIKPHNLLVDRQGRVRVLDLGLARMTQRARDSDRSISIRITETGQVMGTVDYMSPEQALDTRDADERSDIYSLGCTLFFLLTGRPPFPRDSIMQKIDAHRRDPPPNIREQHPQVPEIVQRLVERMLAKAPEDRQASMKRLVAELSVMTAAGLANAASAQPQALTERPLPPPEEPRALAVIGPRELAATSGDQLSEAVLATPMSRRWLTPVLSLAAALLLAVVWSSWSWNNKATKGELAGVGTGSKLSNGSDSGNDNGDQGAGNNNSGDDNSGTSGGAGQNPDEPPPPPPPIVPNPRVLKSGLGTTTYLDIAPDGQQIVTNATPRVFGLADLSLKFTLAGHPTFVESARYSQGLQFVVTGCKDGKVRIFSLETGELSQTFTGHTKSVWMARFFDNDKKVASCSADGTVRIWDVATVKTLQTFTEGKGEVRDVQISPDGSRLVSVGHDRRIRMWNLTDGKLVFETESYPSQLTSVAFVLGGRSLLLGADDGHVRLVSPETGEPRQSLGKHDGWCFRVAVLPNDAWAVSSGNDGTVRLWDLVAGKEVKQHKQHRGQVWGIVPSPDGRLVYSVGVDGQICAWELPTEATTVDLLTPLNLEEAIISGPWKFEGDRLVSPTEGYSRVALGAPPAQEYEVTFQAQRIGGGGSHNITFPYRGKRVTLGLDVPGGPKGRQSGFELLDGKRVFDCPLKYVGTLFPPREEVEVAVRIERDRITALRNGEEFLRLENGWERLANHPEWVYPDGKICLGTIGCQHEFSRISVRALTPTPPPPSRQVIGGGAF